MTVIVGIDPGSRITGYGVIRHRGSKTEFIACGSIRVEKEEMPERLRLIYRGLVDVIEEFNPEEAAIEQVFMGKSAGSALKLGQARGVAMVAAVNTGLPLSEYSARQVKQAVVGRGSALKHQVQEMVTYLLSLTEIPGEDAADALAIAICHAHTHQSLIRMAGASKVRRRRIR